MDKIGEKTLEMFSGLWYNDWLLRKFSRYLSGDILEVGAGIGNFTKRLSKFGKVTAIDFDPEYKNANFGDIEKGKYFFSLKERKGKFDTLICMNVLEHIENDSQALVNMNNLLKEGGKLILLVPAFNWAYSGLDRELGHFRRYTTTEVENKLKDSGFKVLKSSYINWLGLVGWFVFGKILGFKIIPRGELKIFDKIAPLLLYPEKFVNPPLGLSVLAISKK